MSLARKLKRREQAAAWTAPLSEAERALGRVIAHFRSDDDVWAEAAARAFRKAYEEVSAAGLQPMTAALVAHTAICESGGALGECTHTNEELAALLPSEAFLASHKIHLGQLLARVAFALESGAWKSGGWLLHCTPGRRHHSRGGHRFARVSFSARASARRWSFGSRARRMTPARSSALASPSMPSYEPAEPSSVRRIAEAFVPSWQL